MYDSITYTSFDDVLQDVKGDLLLHDTTVWDEWIKDKIMEAAKEIGSFDTTIHRKRTLIIEDLKAKLPCGFIEFDQPRSIVILDNSGNKFYPEYSDRAIFNEKQVFPKRNLVQRNGNYLAFSSDITSQTVDVYYLCVNLDDKDRPLIPESHKRIINGYCKWKYAQINEDKISNSVRMEYRMEWANGKDYLVGQANILDAQKKRIVYRIMNSLR